MNAREHNLGCENEKALAQKRVFVVVTTQGTQKYRSAIGELIVRLLLRFGLENDNVTDFVFAHAMLNFNQLTVEEEAACGEPMPATADFRCLRTARVRLRGSTQGRS
jgi:hypothetical protein